MRTGTADIYAQRVLATGAVDPAWPTDGRALCAASGNQYVGSSVSDGAGGAIVAWEDMRTGTADIYAQRVLATGAVDPVWPSDGRPLCTAAGDQSGVFMVTDATGGAIVTWGDGRNDADNPIYYAQRILGTGAIDPAWPTDGRALTAATAGQFDASIVSDGAEGAIVAWDVSRIYAQRVLATGAVDPAWPSGGRALCSAAGEQYYPSMIADGAGGAIVVWADFRNVTGDIYAQRLLAEGVTPVLEQRPDLQPSLDVLATPGVPGPIQVRYVIDRPRTRAQLSIHDIRGRKLFSLAEAPRDAGEHFIDWDANDLPNGVYVARLQADAVSIAKKFVLIR
jgi:hypothetical protein